MSLSNNDLIKYLDDFFEIYKKRPIKNNFGGMGINHCFALYSILRSLKPNLIIESGVWKGQSTYIIENALPKSNIVCLDPIPKNRLFNSKNAIYFENDFVGIDWTKFDIKNSLCFFDDHQNAYSRLMEMKWWGFNRAIFEDNFPDGEGDCYSLKNVLSGLGHFNIQMSKEYLPKGKNKLIRKIEEWVLNRYYWRQSMIRKKNDVDKAALKLNLKNYFEVIPLILNKKNFWGRDWSGYYELKNKPFYSNWESNKNLLEILSSMNTEEIKNELNYCFICYVEI